MASMGLPVLEKHTHEARASVDGRSVEYEPVEHACSEERHRGSWW
jgi:hypothetical protein